jgi:hypothetical protein
MCQAYEAEKEWLFAKQSRNLEQAAYTRGVRDGRNGWACADQQEMFPEWIKAYRKGYASGRYPEGTYREGSGI